MNELSNLNQLVTEIKFFENQAVNSYWEIGKRLAQAKEQIPHGEWMNWVDENLGYSQDTTVRLIRIYKEFSNSATMPNLSFTKVLALTSIKDEAEREEFIANNPVEEMTVRELKEEVKQYKKQIRDQDQELETLRNQEPQVIEKEVIKEVKPNDYECNKQTAERLAKENEELRKKLVAERSAKKEAINQLESEKQQEQLIREINGFAWTINGFIRQIGGLLYLTDYIDQVPPSNKKLFLDSAKVLDEWSSQLVYNINNKGAMNDISS